MSLGHRVGTEPSPGVPLGLLSRGWLRDVKRESGKGDGGFQPPWALEKLGRSHRDPTGLSLGAALASGRQRWLCLSPGSTAGWKKAGMGMPTAPGLLPAGIHRCWRGNAAARLSGGDNEVIYGSDPTLGSAGCHRLFVPSAGSHCCHGGTIPRVPLPVPLPDSRTGIRLPQNDQNLIFLPQSQWAPLGSLLESLTPLGRAPVLLQSQSFSLVFPRGSQCWD